MNDISFDKLMQDTVNSFDKKRRLLLHCCCAPCSTSCLERLSPYFEITAFFYNPNIENPEYERRKAELIRFLNETGLADYIDCDHNTAVFYNAVKGLESCKEGGERCKKCFELRLGKTRDAAFEKGYDYFTTTLTVSPMKDAKLINSIGERLGGTKWLYSDFKKRNGYLRSIQLSGEHSLYRQNYCGCVFSQRKTDNIYGDK